jgi:hypothetical protein
MEESVVNQMFLVLDLEQVGEGSGKPSDLRQALITCQTPSFVAKAFHLTFNLMSFRAPRSSPDNLNAPLQKHIKTLLLIPLICLPISLNERPQLSKELFDWIEIR